MPTASEQEALEKKWMKMTKSRKSLYKLDGNKTVEYDGVVYPKYAEDEKTGLPLIYSDKDFGRLVRNDTVLLMRIILCTQWISGGLACGVLKGKAIHVEKSGSTPAYDIALNTATINAMRDFMINRLKNHKKIYYTRSKNAGHTKPRKPQVQVYGAEFVNFFRQAAKQRLFGTKRGKKATKDTDEDDLLLPSTKEGMKDKFPILFGYAFKGVSVMKKGYCMSLLHHFLNMSAVVCEASKKEVNGEIVDRGVRVEVNVVENGKQKTKEVRIYGKTFELPDVMKEKLENCLAKLERETNANALKNPNQKEAVYYSDVNFSANKLVIALAAPDKSDESVSSTSDQIKEIRSDEDAYEELLANITNETKSITDGIEIAKKRREEAAKENAPKRNRNSKRKSANERRDEDFENE